MIDWLHPDRPRPPRTRWRPTREGGALLALGGCLLVLGLLTGDNLVYLLVAVLLACFVVEGVLGVWNLRGLDVARVLPAELFAGAEGRGRYVVFNRRSWLPALALVVEEDDGAAARIAAVAAGGEGTGPTGWRFASRGTSSLRTVRVGSSFPFGWVRRWREVDVPADVLVYPKPLASLGRGEPGTHGMDEGAVRQGGPGDFVGLRPYRPGDPPKMISWRTTARTGEPMVVLRGGAGVERVLVRVHARKGEAWERELGRAAGEILRAFAAGASVGLELPDVRFEPRTGDGWRRELLDALARAPSTEGA